MTSEGTGNILNSSSEYEFAAYKRNVPIWTLATPADINTDRRNEGLVRYGHGRVVALDYTR
ncbi:hypothetical protein [Halocatena marina]|uniref:hypothetical protein n=1 Tax=Halocatena marina TaxID=2934937 RepID=UPI00200F6130|nr:hypothetical protein [Halocatena marina]